MPAKLKQYHAALKSLQKKQEINPSRQCQADIIRLQARIQDKKKQKRAKAKEKRATLPISIAGSHVIDEKAKSQYPINGDNQPLQEAYRKVDDARSAADNAITDLRILRSKDNASPDEVDAARKAVVSTMTEANQLAVAIALAEDDAQASPRREAIKTHHRCLHEQPR